MSVEYAPKGLIGLLTPQANTTVEPEMAIMTPPGYAFINARLMSDKPTIEARLVDYFATLSGQLRQFANAPIGTALVATSGMSYLAGVDAEARILAEVSRDAGIPVFTSAIASVEMLQRARREAHRARLALSGIAQRGEPQVLVRARLHGGGRDRRVQGYRQLPPDLFAVRRRGAGGARRASRRRRLRGRADARHGNADAGADPPPPVRARRARHLVHAGDGLAHDARARQGAR